MNTDRITAARLLAGLSYDALALRLGIGRMNVMRWKEGKKPIPKKQIRPLSIATGFPEQWFYGGELQGLIVARPLHADSTAPRNIIDANREQIDNLLPELCVGATISALYAPGGAVYLYAMQRCCLVVFSPQKLNLAVRGYIAKAGEITEELWQRGWSGSPAATAEILKKAGLDGWSILSHNAHNTRRQLNVSLTVHLTDSESEYLATAEIARFVNDLRRRNGFAVEYSFASSWSKE